MSDKFPQLFHCPTCGASLPTPKTDTVHCGYCGSNVLVPIEIRPPKQTLGQVSKPVVFPAKDQPATSKPFKRSTAYFGLSTIGILVIVTFGLVVFTSIFSTRTPTPEQDKNLLAVQNLQFGGDGSGVGQFINPRYICVDLAGYIYVADYDTGRVQKFDPQGNFVFLINIDPDRNNNTIIDDLGIDNQGILYIVRHNEILAYNTQDGKFLSKITADYHIIQYQALAVDPTNMLYALSDMRVKLDLIKLDAGGQHLWKQEDIIGKVDQKTAVGQLDLAVDGLGRSYILNGVGYQVYKYSPQGDFMDRFGSKGEGAGQFQLPRNVAVDNKGHVFVADTHGILIFDENGSYLNIITRDVKLGTVWEITFDRTGQMYVVTNKSLVARYTLQLDRQE